MEEMVQTGRDITYCWLRQSAGSVVAAINFCSHQLQQLQMDWQSTADRAYIAAVVGYLRQGAWDEQHPQQGHPPCTPESLG